MNCIVTQLMLGECDGAVVTHLGDVVTFFSYSKSFNDVRAGGRTQGGQLKRLMARSILVRSGHSGRFHS